MTFLTILDEAKAEQIAGGRSRRFAGIKVGNIKVNQKAWAKNDQSAKSTAYKGGTNTVAAAQDIFQLNNLGYANFPDNGEETEADAD